MMTIREMTPGDYDRVAELWDGARGVGLSGADSRAGVVSFLTRSDASAICGQTIVADRGLSNRILRGA